MFSDVLRFLELVEGVEEHRGQVGVVGVGQLFLDAQDLLAWIQVPDRVGLPVTNRPRYLASISSASDEVQLLDTPTIAYPIDREVPFAFAELLRKRPYSRW